MRYRRMGGRHGVYLEVRIDPDGDIFVSVGQIGDGEQTVDFPSEISGGGCSPRTYKILQALLQAMKEDNEDENLPSSFRGYFKENE